MAIRERAPALANMSAPPRSVVMLPRLAPPAPAPRAASARERRAAALGIPLGPGGGAVLSHAVCVGRVEWPAALLAFLRLPCDARRVAGPLGVARAVVAVARTRLPRIDRASHARAALRSLREVRRLADADVVGELAERVSQLPWPQWVPRVGFVTRQGADLAALVDGRPPRRPGGVTCPLLAARLVAAIRGAVFLRGAAPSLAHLMSLSQDDAPVGAWEIWLPVRPGQWRPAPPAPDAAGGAP